MTASTPPLDPFLSLLSGSAAGVVADLLTHPISTVKTRLQVQGASRAGAGSLVQYRGLWHATSAIARAEGAAGLYKGVGIVVASAAPAQGLYFAGYDAARAALPKDYALSNFAAGCAAQLCGSLFWVPMDTVKERLQIEGQLLAASGARLGGSWSAVRTIVKQEGLLGLYPAYWMHQATWAPFNGLFFAAYEAAKGFAAAREWPTWWCAPLAGVVAGTVTNPADLIKTRLQVRRANPGVFAYAGPLDCARQLVRNEGWLALFDGTIARCVLIAPRLTIAVSLKEYLDGWLQGGRQ